MGVINMNIKNNLFFKYSANKNSIVSKIRQHIWIINIIALIITFIGIIVIHLSLQINSITYKFTLLAGLFLIFIGSHIFWAGLASLRGLEDRLEGVEEG